MKALVMNFFWDADDHLATLNVIMEEYTNVGEVSKMLVWQRAF